MRLQGKIALITGGSTGIGRATVRRFAAEGAAIAVADINDADGQAAADEVGGIYLHCDVADASQCEAAVRQTADRFGGLDILIASAAHLGGYHDAAAMSVDEWRAVNAVTLDGVFYCSKYALPELVKRGGGAIVIIASVEGVMGAANHAAYVTAKSALFGLTRSMAIDFGKRGVRVNAISPGIIDVGRPDQLTSKQDPRIMQFWRDMTVLDRMGRPEEIAAAALFLASDDASYLTGQNIAVDGGWTIGHPPIHLYDTSA